MEASAGLVAGSHNRNELVVIRSDGEFSRKPYQQLSGQTCHICGDDVGLTVDGELFVACNECAFPICKTCYEYERREGSQVCPQCKTRFKRLKGCARVVGDEEEDDVDDLENEFNIRDKQKNFQNLAGDMDLKPTGLFHNTLASLVPLLTDGGMPHFDGIPPERHALVPAHFASGNKRTHPLPSTDSSLPVQPKSLDPSKDLAAYGYGSVAWKERMENWKQRQEHLHTLNHETGGKDQDDGGEGPNLPLIRTLGG